MVQFNFDAIGTKWQIDIYTTLPPDREAGLYSKLMSRIDMFDKAYSRFRNDSLVTEMSKKTGTYELPEDAVRMMSFYYDMYKKTNGLVTPLVGNIISDAGYDAQYSLKQKGELSETDSWESALDWNAGTTLVVKKPVLLDFGAAGKGYLIDIVGELFEAENIPHYCIDAGGDILHKNDTLIRVGLENPENLNQVVGVYELQNESICGSAGNRRVWGNFTHIMNPHTRTSPRDILAVWVSAKTALVADGLATCLFFVEPEVLTGYTFEYFIIRGDHTFKKSPNFKAEIFIG